MNLGMMKLFCDVVRCRNFSQGAAMNGISQSAASQRIERLEREVGADLIDRTKRPCVLTPEGELFYAGFSDILHRFEAIQAEVMSLRQDISGLVRVAAIYSVGLHEMSTCMQDFMTRYPKARVRLEYLLPQKIYEAVLHDQVDLGIISYPAPGRELAVIPLRTENMVMVCHPQHHLATYERIGVKQLHGENFVAFDRDLAICRELDGFLREHHVGVRKVMEFDNIETIKQAVEIGAGVSILPEPTVRMEVATGSLAAVALRDGTLERPIGIVHRQQKSLTPVLRKFIEVLQVTHAAAEAADAAPPAPAGKPARTAGKPAKVKAAGK